VHFGLGDATKVTQLLVRYPDGSKTHFTDLAVDQIIDVGR
jgi:ASPIC/UnbV protein